MLLRMVYCIVKLDYLLKPPFAESSSLTCCGWLSPIQRLAVCRVH